MHASISLERSFRLITICGLALALAAGCSDDDTGHKDGGSSGGDGSSGSVLQQQLQGSWLLTKLDCDGVDHTSQVPGALNVNIAGSNIVVARSDGSCTVTSAGTATFNDANGTLTIVSTGPDVCQPSGCDSDCDGETPETEVMTVSAGGSTFVVTASDAEQFPDDFCTEFDASRPGAATFTKQ